MSLIAAMNSSYLDIPNSPIYRRHRCPSRTHSPSDSTSIITSIQQKWQQKIESSIWDHKTRKNKKDKFSLHMTMVGSVASGSHTSWSFRLDIRDFLPKGSVTVRCEHDAVIATGIPDCKRKCTPITSVTNLPNVDVTSLTVRRDQEGFMLINIYTINKCGSLG